MNDIIMTKFGFFIALTCAFTLTTACGGRKRPSVQFDKIVYQPVEASGFAIKGSEGAKSVVLEVKNPWQGADSVSFRLFIARDGEKAPGGFDGQVIEGDAERVVAMSSTYVAMLDAIDEGARVVGVSGIDFISSPSIQNRRSEVGDVGYDSGLDYETLVALDPDLVLLYGIYGPNVMEAKLRELKIPYVYLGDYVEQSPLGKAEWMVAVGEIVGEREAAEHEFLEVKRAYESLAASVDRSKAPAAMINAPYGDAWYIPSANSYVARLIADAGGRLVDQSNSSNTSATIGTEEAYALASRADVWLDPGNAASMADLVRATPQFADVKAVAQGKVFNNTLRSTPAGGNDFYESGAVRPDLVLADLIKIFGDSVNPVFNYYVNLR